ncbi:hypothetical protein [Nocardia mexicana]|uniref:Uncharacterized protein n=1 Tax=Nocardia mexicana TaxID=279262 RepID=A0A370GJQ2_9NOCA|nr:hypothetical protein [Nocardia mexicana]RDI43857.1 hypothetical protein DFR68_11837 [Nocardia mexicana]
MTLILVSRWEVRPSDTELDVLCCLARFTRAVSIPQLTRGQLTISAAKALRRLAERGFVKTGVAHRNGRAEPVWWLTNDGRLLHDQLNQTR